MRTKKFRAFGLDAVTLILFTDRASQLPHRRLVRFLEIVTREHVNKSTGEIREQVRKKFKIRNLSFIVSDTSVWVIGSLATYLYGSNLIPLRFEDFPRVLAKLQNETGLDFSESIVYLLELSSSISMNGNPNWYSHFYKPKGLY